MMPSHQSLPPAQPAFILRGHSAQIHALHFTQNNARLLTGDAEGWIVSWNLAFKRPVAVWKAHDNAILGVGSWGADKIITLVFISLYLADFANRCLYISHGRDHKLIVWQLQHAAEEQMDRILPVDATDLTKQPWILHVLPVNTLNFCAFAMCLDGMPPPQCVGKAIQDTNTATSILVAIPSAVDSGGVSSDLAA